MKAFPLERIGSADRLKMKEVPDPGKPAPGFVRIKTRSIGVNFAEILSRKGQYSWAPKRPYTIGMELFGTIEEVGEGVSEQRVGQAVLAGMQYGAYAEYVNVPEHLAFPAFEGFSDAENAAMLVNYTTAWIALFCQARVRPGETVLVQAAAGGVGTAAVQLLKAHGCTVIGLASRPEKLDLLRKLNADLVVNYATQDFHQVVLEKDMRPGVVLELVGGEVFRKSYDLLKPFGRMAVAGFASIPLKKWNPLTWWPTWKAAPKARLMDMAKRSIGMHATHIGYLIEQPELVLENFNAMAEFVREHGIRPVVGREFEFADAAKAHAFVESRESFGKVVLTM